MILSRPKCPDKPPTCNPQIKKSLSEVQEMHNLTPLKIYLSLRRKSPYVGLRLSKDSLKWYQNLDIEGTYP